MAIDPTKDPVLSKLLQKFAQAEACWFSSVRADGRAHLAPIWHVWHEGRVYVVTPATSVRARNITRNPAVSLSLPDPMTVLIIEGIARSAPEQRAAIQPLFKAKYDWDISSDSAYGMVIEVTPQKVLAWGSDGEGRWQLNSGGES
jgi:general stress protein 26